MKRKAIFAQRATSLWAIIILILPWFYPTVSQAANTDLVISEIMYDLEGSDSGGEWIEVYNSGSETIEVLTGTGAGTWRFFDGANHILNLANGSSTIATNEYFIIASDAQNFLSSHPGFTATVFDTVMSLNNSSSTIALSFDGGQTQGVSASYEAIWGAGGNNKTLEKINLTQDSSQSNWQESFVLGGTPGQAKSQSIDLPPDGGDDNDSPGDDEVPPIDDTPVSGGGGGGTNNYWSQIRISEFLPNPVGSDEAEWIEIYNQGQNTVDLSGFKLQDNSAGQYTIGQGLLLAGQAYLVLYKNQTKISLNNTGGDSVKIYSPGNNILDSAIYEASAPEGKSFALINGSFVWTPSPTPGQVNFLPDNQAPKAVIKIDGDQFFVDTKIIFSGADSTDPEEGDLKYFWDFGDGQSGDEAKENHTYEKAGNYLVKLKVVDPAGISNEFSKNIVVEDKELDLKLKDIKPIDFNKNDLLITEFLPNPVGSDDAEWIELHNASAKDIDLLGWQLDDQDGGSKAYTFATSTSIVAGGFLVVDRSLSRITLNNTEDSVRILTPVNELWQEVKYSKIPEGQSYAWDMNNQEWSISDSPSPGQINIINLEAAATTNQTLQKGQVENIQATVWGQNNKILYVLDEDNNFFEVYGSADFSKLLRGDFLNIFGKITRLDPWLRVKVEDIENVSLIENRELAKSGAIESSDVDIENNGQLLTIRGVVVKKNGKNIYLSDDIDEDYNLRLSLKFDIKDLKIDKGVEIIATGLLQANEKSIRLDVFDQKDLQTEQKVLGEKISLATSTNIAVAGSNFSQTKKTIKIILLFILLGLFFFFVYKKIKNRRV